MSVGLLKAVSVLMETVRILTLIVTNHVLMEMSVEQDVDVKIQFVLTVLILNV